MTTLVSPAAVVLSPNPGPAPGVSRDRARARELRAWQRGERPDLAVTYRGKPITPERVDWSEVDTGSGSSGGASSHARVGPVRFPPADEAALEALCERWGCDRSEAVRRAVREAAGSAARKVDA